MNCWRFFRLFRPPIAVTAATIIGLCLCHTTSLWAVPLTPEPNSVYSASVWRTTATSQAATLSAATDAGRPEGAAASAVLDCYAGDGTAVVRLSYWADAGPAAAFAATAPLDPTRTTLFTLASAYGKPDATDTISEETYVQWSEFLLNQPESLEPLSKIVGPMTNGMVSSQPTLTLTREMHATDQTSIALFAVWTDRAGFDIFAENNTFGDTPYWEPYAENEHWMCSAALMS